jgi:hypothetical protein
MSAVLVPRPLRRLHAARVAGASLLRASARRIVAPGRDDSSSAPLERRLSAGSVRAIARRPALGAHAGVAARAPVWATPARRRRRGGADGRLQRRRRGDDQARPFRRTIPRDIVDRATTIRAATPREAVGLAIGAPGELNALGKWPIIAAMCVGGTPRGAQGQRPEAESMQGNTSS